MPQPRAKVRRARVGRKCFCARLGLVLHLCFVSAHWLCWRNLLVSSSIGSGPIDGRRLTFFVRCCIDRMDFCKSQQLEPKLEPALKSISTPLVSAPGRFPRRRICVVHWREPRETSRDESSRAESATFGHCIRCPNVEPVHLLQSAQLASMVRVCTREFSFASRLRSNQFVADPKRTLIVSSRVDPKFSRPLQNSGHDFASRDRRHSLAAGPVGFNLLASRRSTAVGLKQANSERPQV